MQSVDAEEVERFSRIAEEWWDTEGKFKPLHRINPVRIAYLKEKLCAHFGRNPDEAQPLSGITLLDIGCGGGLISEPMARMGATVTGLDASEKNIKVAGLHAQQGGLNITYRASSAEALLAEGAQFDAVLALEVVEHVADVQSFVAAASGLLKPGGLTLWSTINRTPKAYALAIIGAEYVLRWLPVGTHTWKKFLKPAELGGELRKNGLKIQEMTGMVMNPLTFRWEMNARDISVNYLMTAIKN